MPSETQGRTGQYYDSRIIAGPQAHEAAADFIRLAGEQSGRTFRVTVSTDAECVVDLARWPQREAFGDWFDRWATRWSLTVED